MTFVFVFCIHSSKYTRFRPKGRLINPRGLKNENVHKYVESIAHEADEIASIWHEIVTSIIDEKNIDRDKIMNMGAHKWVACNSAPYSKINQFYKEVSDAIGISGGTHLVDKVLFHISRMIIDRDNADKVLINLIDNIDNEIYFSELNQKVVLEDLSSSVNALRNEASALHTLAKKIEAKNYRI